MSQAEPRVVGASSEQLVIDDPEKIKVVADPLRLRLMLETIDAPRTAKELAVKLGVPQTRLYYHLKLLEKHGLIRVAERRMVSGIEERSYKSPRDGWTISPDVMSDAVNAGLLATMLDLTRAELEMALAAPGPEAGSAEGNVPVLTFSRMWLTADEVAEIQRAIMDVLERSASSMPGPGRTEYNAALALYRTNVRPSAVVDHDAS